MEEKKKILILDDEPIVGERLKATLERADFVVDTFSSSKLALERLHSVSYDILVTDLKMSGPDGMFVLKEARKLQPDIKVVVITGFATASTAEEALQSGAVMFIAKPFKMSQLKSLLLDLSKGETKPDE
jgi:DNA-binding NtrC family response regulator